MPTYSSLFEDLTPSWDGQIHLRGLNSPGLAYLVSQLLDGPLADNRLLILTPSALEAEDLVTDLRFFWRNGPVKLLAGFESKPFLNQITATAPSAERLNSLLCLAQKEKPAVVVACISAALRLVPPADSIIQRTMTLEKGKEIDFVFLKKFLADNGYSHVGQVESVGTYSVRGGLIDVFPAGQDKPVRIEFFGDFIESLRVFMVDDQKSIGSLDRLVIPPASEVVVAEQVGEKAACALEKLAKDKNWLSLLCDPLASRFRNRSVTSDLENWAPLFDEKRVSLSAFLKQCGVKVLLSEPSRLFEAGQASWLNLDNHFNRLEQEERPHLPVTDIFERPKKLLEEIIEGSYISSEEMVIDGGDFTGLSPITFQCENNNDLKAAMTVPRRATGLLGPLAARIKALLGRGFSVNLVLRTKEQKKRLAEMLSEYELSPDKDFKGRLKQGTLLFTVGQLSGGFVAHFDNVAYISEDEIFGAKHRLRRRATEEFRGLKGFNGLKDLTSGDYVVHSEHGIGQYLGLVTLILSNGQKGDFLDLCYRSGDKLYVPVERFSSVSKYVGAADHPPHLDALGTGSWEKLKNKVKENIREMAEDLLKLYAARQTTQGFSFSPRDQEYMEFEAAFQYEATADQEKAIDDVLSDLSASKPMDRLVCGDVGYGKTEVAMRAAFKVAMDCKQVAVLVPTTILVEQHERSFIERFASWPISVASLSRFKKPSEQKEVLKKLSAGTIDVVVGTHRLLQKDVAFKDLGLLVIDEEHRFGVADKERLKKLRTEVDVLAMSATPIPRSLSMSMSGIRDMSLIETSPQDRLTVKTSLMRRQDEAIVEAIDIELARGGQVFFIHNRVKDLGVWVKRLEGLMPLVRFGVGHGQMKPQELEEVMRKFLNREIDVWISTSIVESGLDFPSANTIIIDQADRFGLAQLYQLRGRVGRGHIQAYAYLMIDDPDTLTDDARKRLKALLDHTELGSGYQIALHDLQIRGSGNILGAAQSGQASLVGYEMYSQLLEQTIRELKNEPWEEQYEPEVVIGLPAYIPESYAPDTEMRLVLYRRLASCADERQISEIVSEMEDRLGKPPIETQNLLDLMVIKILLRKAQIRRLENGSEGLTVTFGPQGPASYEKVMSFISGSKFKNRLTPAGRLFVAKGECAHPGRPLEGVMAVLGKLI
ncbi:MAG: transcription-repair coupling factor [Deltaproteobacteria bacterium]|jgi:transcription-repair coupling factor (superfamily II helicase)|nr:transcription-repair coupling factor [Deltaproteobacteria bacterium]